MVDPFPTANCAVLPYLNTPFFEAYVEAIDTVIVPEMRLAGASEEEIDNTKRILHNSFQTTVEQIFEQMFGEGKTSREVDLGGVARLYQANKSFFTLLVESGLSNLRSIARAPGDARVAPGPVVVMAKRSQKFDEADDMEEPEFE